MAERVELGSKAEHLLDLALRAAANGRTADTLGRVSEKDRKVPPTSRFLRPFASVQTAFGMMDI